MQVSALVDQLYTDLRKTILDKDVHAQNIISIVMKVMVLVQKVPDISGADKQAVVIQVIKRLVGEIQINEDDRAAIQSALDLFLPSIIDSLVSADHGALSLQKVEDGCRGIFSCWRK